MKRLWFGMEALTSKLTIWPDPRDLMTAGSKLYLELIILRSASSMNLSHPQASVVNPSAELLQRIRNGKMGAVLKREFSSHGKLVYGQKTPILTLTNQLARENDDYQGTEGVFSKPRWFLQPFIPSLAYLGLIGVFIVNGVIFRTVVTTPNVNDPQALDIQDPVFLTPLSELK